MSPNRILDFQTFYIPRITKSHTLTTTQNRLPVVNSATILFVVYKFTPTKMCVCGHTCEHEVFLTVCPLLMRNTWPSFIMEGGFQINLVALLSVLGDVQQLYNSTLNCIMNHASLSFEPRDGLFIVHLLWVLRASTSIMLNVIVWKVAKHGVRF